MSEPVRIRGIVSAAETVGQRVRALQAQARAEALEHARELVDQLSAAQSTAAEIAAVPDAYPAGVVNEARLLAVDLASRIETLTAIIGRVR